MSGEIKIQYASAETGITALRSSIQALETTFAKEIEGQNKLEMISTFNEIKKEYEMLLSQYEALFMNNVQAAEDAVAKFEETDQAVANAIKLTD